MYAEGETEGFALEEPGEGGRLCDVDDSGSSSAGFDKLLGSKDTPPKRLDSDCDGVSASGPKVAEVATAVEEPEGDAEEVVRSAEESSDLSSGDNGVIDSCSSFNSASRAANSSEDEVVASAGTFELTSIISGFTPSGTPPKGISSSGVSTLTTGLSSPSVRFGIPLSKECIIPSSPSSSNRRTSCFLDSVICKRRAEGRRQIKNEKNHDKIAYCSCQVDGHYRWPTEKVIKNVLNER